MGSRFPFGKVALGAGAALFVATPVAFSYAMKLDERLPWILSAYAAGFVVTLGLGVAAFVASSGERKPPNVPPAPIAGGAPPAPVEPPPPGPTGERIAATAGVTLAGVGCGVVAIAGAVAVVFLAIGLFVIWQILKAIFFPH